MIFTIHTSNSRKFKKLWLRHGGVITSVNRTGEARYTHHLFSNTIRVNDRRKDVPAKLLSRLNTILHLEAIEVANIKHPSECLNSIINPDAFLSQHLIDTHNMPTIDIKINRRGALADHGRSSISFESFDTFWDQTQQAICIKSKGIPDFNTTARHNYELFIPLDVISRMLEILAGDGIRSSPSAIEEKLTKNLKALVRLTAITSGIFQHPSSVETEIKSTTMARQPPHQ